MDISVVPSRQEPDFYVESTFVPHVVSVLSARPLSQNWSSLVPIPQIGSPDFPRSVRARLSPAIFDHAMFRTIFSRPDLSAIQDPSGPSTNFSFSFSIDAAPTSIATTFHYDKHIVDS